MNRILKNILQTIEKNGFEAYLVGGYVRDYLLGINSLDVDICTNALPKDLHQIFPNNTNSNNYGGFNLQVKGYNIDITTYRQEIKYNNRKPTEIIYINNLSEDIKRRDFTINSVCMDKNEKIIDLENGIEDINNHLIRMIEKDDILKRLEEDPLRILRAIRFASILDFNLDDKLYDTIKNNYKLVTNLSDIRIKSEITKILLNKNYLKGLKLLKELNIAAVLGIDFDEVVYVNDICGMWAQLKFNKNYAFTKQEMRNIINIRQIINIGKIDNEVIYNFGLYNSLIAADILNINKKYVTNLYKKMPIKNESELNITTEEIIEVLNIKPSKVIKDVKKEIINEILNGRLNNKNKNIKEYLKRKGR